MTFVAVDALRKRFPDHEIYLLSELDRRRPEKERAQYRFRFTGWYPIKFARAQHNPALRLACLLRNRAELLECEALYRNCDLMVDISGYGLGSNWGEKQLCLYLDHLEFAKAFGIPCYLLPQSFGPFDFHGEEKTQGDRIPELLSSVKLICAREQQGYDDLRRLYHLENVILRPDLVLSSRDVSLNNVFSAPPAIELTAVGKNSVAIVPNENTVSAVGEEKILTLYGEIVRALVQAGKHVYLLSHSSADKWLCEKIKAQFPNDEICYLDRDFSCLEYSELVKRFDFVICSRYHGIVHAFKNGVPCVSIGWAAKYHELMSYFGQEGYAFDVEAGLSSPEIIESILLLNDRREQESGKIRELLTTVQNENVFDLLEIKKTR